MITKEQFIEIINLHKEHVERLNGLHDYGFDLWNTDIIEFGLIMFDRCIDTSFNEDGEDWINWWLFERDNEWCSEIGKAWDENGKEIPTETIEDLWNIVEKYRI